MAREAKERLAADSNYLTFGQLLRQYRVGALREQLGHLVSQEELAQKANLTRDVYRRIEADQLRSMTTTNVHHIIVALHKELNLTRDQLNELSRAAVNISDLVPRSGAGTILGLSTPSVEPDSFWMLVERSILDLAWKTHGQASYRTIPCHHYESVAEQIRHLAFFESLDQLGAVILAPAPGNDAGDALRAPDVKKHLARLTKRRVPIVTIDRRLETFEAYAPYVGMDNKHAGRIAAQRLFDRGHRRIALYSGLLRVPALRDRREGWMSVVKAANIYRSEYDVSLPDDVGGSQDYEHVRRYARRVLDPSSVGSSDGDKVDPPTAVVCATSYCARALIDEARRSVNRLNIPDDLSIISLDDVPSLDDYRPTIARISYRPTDLAAHALIKVRALVELYARQNELGSADELAEQSNEVRADDMYQCEIVEGGSIKEYQEQRD